MINIAVDGPAGAGKSTVSRTVAKSLDLIYVDTGALYRAVGLAALNRKIDTKDRKALAELVKHINVDLDNINGEQIVLLNGANVSGDIRTQAVSMAASDVSAHPEVRSFLLDVQKNIALKKNIIMDGRDIGTVILPNADVKIFLTASPEVRAQRRYLELTQRGLQANYDTILKEINERDHNDMTRETAPLKQADDAVLLDTSEISFDEAVQRMIQLIKSGVDVVE